MEVDTLSIARSLCWKVHVRCADGYREGTKSMRWCVYRKQLDLETLDSARGPNFPLSRLESRLMCPACGSRRVTVVFEPPTNRQVRGVMSSHPTAQSSKRVARYIPDRCHVSVEH
jgi:hypothetical protein